MVPRPSRDGADTVLRFYTRPREVARRGLQELVDHIEAIRLLGEPVHDETVSEEQNAEAARDAEQALLGLHDDLLEVLLRLQEQGMADAPHS